MTREQKKRIENIADAFECSVDCLLDALECNVVSEQIGWQVRYQQTGKLPGEE